MIVASVEAALYVLVKVGSAEVTEAVNTPPWNAAVTVTSLPSSSNVIPEAAAEVSSLMT